MPSLYQGQGSPSPVSAPTSSTWSSRYCCSSRSRYPASTASVHLRPPPSPSRQPRRRDLALLNRTAATAQQSSGSQSTASVRTTGTSHTASAAAATARTDGCPLPKPPIAEAEANLPGGNGFPGDRRAKEKKRPAFPGPLFAPGFDPDLGSAGGKRVLVSGSCFCPKLWGPIRVCPRVGCLPAFS
jgi:hypothetical protein